MNKRYIILLLLLCTILSASANEAVALLDKAVARLKADFPVELSFTCSIYDNDGTLLQVDESAGELNIAAGGKYTISASGIKVWCDGVRQWNYMEQTNEIYITTAGSEEAQNFSPLYLMELYKLGYTCTYNKVLGMRTVTLAAKSDDDPFTMVVVTLDDENRIKALALYTAEGYTVLAVTAYKAGVKLDDTVFTCPTDEYSGAEVIDMME